MQSDLSESAPSLARRASAQRSRRDGRVSSDASVSPGCARSGHCRCRAFHPCGRLGDHPGLVAAYGFEEASGTSRARLRRAGAIRARSSTASLACPPAASAPRSPSTAQRPGDRAGLELARPVERDDARGVGQPGASSAAGAPSCSRSARRSPTRSTAPTRRAPDGGRQHAPGVTRRRAARALEPWTHLAATYDGAAVRLYVDGPRSPQAPAPGSLAVSGDPLRIGGNAVWGEWFNGLIDDVRVYNRALTASEAADGHDDARRRLRPPRPPAPSSADPDRQLSPPQPTGRWWPSTASMLSNGKVAVWDGFGAALRSERDLGPGAGAPSSRCRQDKNFFCSGHVLLPDGRLFIAGGHGRGLRREWQAQPATSTRSARSRWTARPDVAPRALVPHRPRPSLGRQGPHPNHVRRSPPAAPTGLGCLRALAADRARSLRPGDGHLDGDDRQSPGACLPLHVPDSRRPRAVRGRHATRPRTSSTPRPALVGGAGPSAARRTRSPGRCTRRARSCGTGGRRTPPWPAPRVDRHNGGDPALGGDRSRWRFPRRRMNGGTFHTHVLPDGYVMAVGGTAPLRTTKAQQRSCTGRDLEPRHEDVVGTVSSMAEARMYHSTALTLPDGRVLLAGPGG